MKKLCVTMLAAALSLPVALAASQAAPAPSQPATKTTKKHAKKRHHPKKPAQAKEATKK